MLVELRRALVDTIAARIPWARYSPVEPEAFDDNAAGLFVHIEPDASAYVDAWLSFTTRGSGTVNVDVVLSVPMVEAGAAAAMDVLDRVIDPLSGEETVFGALLAAPTLGLTAFDVNAVPHLQAVAGPRPERVGGPDSNQVRLVVRIPVRITVERS